MARAVPFVLVAMVALLIGCGIDTADTTGDPTTAPATSPTTIPPTSTTSPAASTTTTVATTTTTTAPRIEGVVFDADGLGVVDFGDEAESALAVLVEVLGLPDDDTGWSDPSDESSELWPGCPGRRGRTMNWVGVGLYVVFSDWDQTSSDARVTVDTPYLAGAVLGVDSPITTPDGARPGDTVGQLRAIYGGRLTITTTADGVFPVVFAIDGTSLNGSLDRTGGLRGNIPADADTVSDDSVPTGFTAGVSCDSP